MADFKLMDRKFDSKLWGFAWYQDFATLWIPMPADFAWFIGTICVFILLLVSPGFQAFFMTRPFQFLGKISYTLYLSHFFFIEVNMQSSWSTTGSSPVKDLAPSIVVKCPFPYTNFIPKSIRKVKCS